MAGRLKLGRITCCGDFFFELCSYTDTDDTVWAARCMLNQDSSHPRSSRLFFVQLGEALGTNADWRRAGTVDCGLGEVQGDVAVDCKARLGSGTLVRECTQR